MAAKTAIKLGQCIKLPHGTMPERDSICRDYHKIKRDQVNALTNLKNSSHSSLKKWIVKLLSSRWNVISPSGSSALQAIKLSVSAIVSVFISGDSLAISHLFLLTK